MSFLASIFANVLEWLLEKFGAMFLSWLKTKEQDSAAKQTAQKDQQERDNAKTPDDQTKAATDTAHDTFS